jgi:hypothetical protein
MCPMPDLNDPQQTNPNAPFRDQWDKQRHDNESGPVILDVLREHHDHLSALTWSEQPKKKETNR